jgi:hypothetical protein
MQSQGTPEQLDAIVAGLNLIKAHLEGREPELSHGWERVADTDMFYNEWHEANLIPYRHADVIKAVGGVQGKLKLGQPTLGLDPGYLYVLKRLTANPS